MAAADKMDAKERVGAAVRGSNQHPSLLVRLWLADE